MPNPTAAMLVIGDEILSGRTRDANMNHLAQELTKRGIDLREVRVVPDDGDAIAEAVNALRSRWDTVVTSGGIGPTHDDITADSIGAALGLPVGVNEEARALLQAHYDRTGRELNEARLRMARTPEGARLIENPVSAAPGFAVGNVYVMAGVPKVFEAMVAAVLPELEGGAAVVSQSLRVERGEGDIAGPLRALAEDFPDLSIGSYPYSEGGVHGAEIVIRGTETGLVEEAMVRLVRTFGG